MGLIEALRANAEFIADGLPPTARSEAGATLVIADSNPDLAGVLADALGIERGQAVVIQLAGAWGGRDGQELLRSVALGLHVHGCSEILVVGSDSAAGVPDRRQLKEILKGRGLDPDGPQAEQLLDLARGPADPQDGVRDTVRLLRTSPLVPEDTPVHGCILQAGSGLLKVIDQDPAIASGKKKKKAQRAKAEAADPLDIPLPELPDIPLPDIPALDLDNLTAPSPPPIKKKSSAAADYGSKGSGPVSMEEMHKMADAEGMPAPQGMAAPTDAGAGWQPFTTTGPKDAPVVQMADVEFQVPETAAIQDTGLGRAEDMRPGQPEIEQEWFEGGGQAQEGVRPLPQPPKRPKPKPAPARKPERPEVTPIIRQAQAPLGERVLEFGEAEPPKPKPKKKQQRSRGPKVDIKAGYVAKDGAEFPLDPELQRALLKVSRFLASEFAAVDRNQIMGRIRKAAHQNQQTGELLKLMIGPVLKLGKKRYAVINELLKIKEELPRQAPDVAVALLEETLTGN